MTPRRSPPFPPSRSPDRRPAVLFETVGVLAHPPETGAPIRGLSDLSLKRGAAGATARLTKAGYFTIALIDLSAAEPTPHWRVAALSARLMAAAGVQGVAYCDEPASTPSPRRAPAPGLILEAAHTYGVDLDRSVVIAASEAMRQAAVEAGVRALMLGEAPAEEGTADAAGRWIRVADLEAAERLILTQQAPAETAGPAEARSVLDGPADQPLERGRDTLLKEGAAS